MTSYFVSVDFGLVNCGIAVFSGDELLDIGVVPLTVKKDQLIAEALEEIISQKTPGATQVTVLLERQMAKVKKIWAAYKECVGYFAARQKYDKNFKFLLFNPKTRVNYVASELAKVGIVPIVGGKATSYDINKASSIALFSGYGETNELIKQAKINYRKLDDVADAFLQKIAHDAIVPKGRKKLN